MVIRRTARSAEGDERKLYRTDLQGEITLTTHGKLIRKVLRNQNGKRSEGRYLTGCEGFKDDSSRSVASSLTVISGHRRNRGLRRPGKSEVRSAAWPPDVQ
jgi:hypothetical protein